MRRVRKHAQRPAVEGEDAERRRCHESADVPTSLRPNSTSSPPVTRCTHSTPTRMPHGV
jgi:hypothetical protein